MDLAERTGQQSDEPGPLPTATPEAIYAVLANRRRRFVVHYLQRNREPVRLGTLAEQLAAWENGVELAAITSKQRKTMYTSLQQRHAPKMDAAGVVEFDRRQGLVTPTPLLDDLRMYAAVVDSRDVRWSHWYLGLSAALAGLTLGVWLALPPFSLLPPTAWLVLGTVAVGGLSLTHASETLTRRLLGRDPKPPEPRERQIKEVTR
jgi:hypothetical protein